MQFFLQKAMIKYKEEGREKRGKDTHILAAPPSAAQAERYIIFHCDTVSGRVEKLRLF